MIKALKNMTGCKSCSPSASVVDGKLILSFPHAETPVVWQMDLSHVKASSLEVLHDDKANGGAGAYTLTLKTPKGEKINAAVFATRDEAIAGLMAASHALENAHGRIQGGRIAANEDHGTGAASASFKPKRRSRWITVLIAIFVVFILFNIWVAMLPKPPNSYQQTTGSEQAQSASPADSAGVPVSADDFLNAQ